MGIAHLGDNGEERWSAGVGKDQSGDGGDALFEGRLIEELKVGLPMTFLGCQRRPVLNTHSDGDN